MEFEFHITSNILFLVPSLVDLGVGNRSNEKRNKKKPGMLNHYSPCDESMVNGDMLTFIYSYI